MAFKRRVKEDKYRENNDMTTSKIAIIAEWIWRIFVLNALTLVTCLGIITIVPSLVSCFRTIKACYEEDETHYIKAFFKNFVYCFKDTVFLSVFVIIILAIFAYAYYYYSVVIDGLIEDGRFKGWLNFYSFMLGLDIIFFLVIFFVVAHFPMVCTYFHFRFIDKIRFSFYMSYRHAGLTLFMLIVFALNTALVMFLPYYAFVGYFSIQSLICFMASRRAYMQVLRKENYNNDPDEFDRTGKQVNRETYEDSNEEKIMQEKVESLKKLNEEIGDSNGKTRNR